jgi:hypothetical protein
MAVTIECSDNDRYTFCVADISDVHYTKKELSDAICQYAVIVTFKRGRECKMSFSSNRDALDAFDKISQCMHGH